MALVVLFDAYCNCSDIDARAKLQHVPQVLQVGAACCLMLLLGRKSMSDFSILFLDTYE